MKNRLPSLYVTDKDGTLLTILDNKAEKSNHYFDEVFTTDVETGYQTLELSFFKKNRETQAIDVFNFINFVHPNGERYSLKINNIKEDDKTKTIVAETGQLIDSLTTYCDSQIRLMGDGKAFFSEMFGRGAKNTILSLSVVLGDKRYSIAVSSVASQSTLTPEDLRIADDLEREWVNVVDPLDLDELNKWVKLFEVIRKKVEGDVLKNSVAPQEVPPVQTPQPQAVETDKPVSKAEEDDIFG